MAEPVLARERISYWTVFLQTAALSALAIAQPLLQLLRENSEFLTVHQSRGPDVLILSAVLLLVPPVILTAIVFLSGLAGSRLRQVVHAFILGGLVFLILLPMVDKIPFINGWVTLLAAAITGIAFAVAFERSRFLQQNLAYLAFVLPVFLALFISAGPVFQILFPAPTPASGPAQSVTAPVVVLIFDEFPTASLMNKNHELDRDLFPNFGRLADHSTWFPNATTISPATMRSVPAILSGRFPGWKDVPTLEVYPNNIFTLLGASHQVAVLESQTSLCPKEMQSGPTPELRERLDLTFDDLFILYQHLVTPEVWREQLVPVADKWSNFRGNTRQDNHRDDPEYRMDQFADLMASVEAGNKPNLAVAHILFPHVPFQFFPNGVTYNKRLKAPVQADGTWGPDSLVVAHSFRRHMVQVVAADRLIGILLDRLDELGILEDAAIVVTADHGACFRTGLHRRQYREGNAADILGVPLFIKTPQQTTGVVDDRLAQTIDIIPTLAAAIGCQLDWPCDGIDLLATDEPVRTQLDFLDQDAREHRKLDPAVLAARDDIIAWKNELFGEEGGWERMFTMGYPEELRGMDVETLDVRDHPTLRGQILDAQDLEDVDLQSSHVPAEFNGTLSGHEDPGRLTLALALNGKIAGVSETYLDRPEPGSSIWQITTTLEPFRNGSNETDLFLVTEGSAGYSLERIPLVTPSFVRVDLGGRHIAGIREEGLFRTSDWDGQPARWTNGKGRWEIPIQEGETLTRLTLKLASSGPAGANLTIRVNGSDLYSGELPHGKWAIQLPLGQISHGNKLIVELNSRVFVPAEVYPESSDQRELGVAVTSLILE